MICYYENVNYDQFWLKVRKFKICPIETNNFSIFDENLHDL